MKKTNLVLLVVLLSLNFISLNSIADDDPGTCNCKNTPKVYNEAHTKFYSKIDEVYGNCKAPFASSPTSNVPGAISQLEKLPSSYGVCIRIETKKVAEIAQLYVGATSQFKEDESGVTKCVSPVEVNQDGTYRDGNTCERTPKDAVPYFVTPNMFKEQGLYPCLDLRINYDGKINLDQKCFDNTTVATSPGAHPRDVLPMRQSHGVYTQDFRCNGTNVFETQFYLSEVVLAPFNETERPKCMEGEVLLSKAEARQLILSYNALENSRVACVKTWADDYKRSIEIIRGNARNKAKQKPCLVGPPKRGYIGFPIN